MQYFQLYFHISHNLAKKFGVDWTVSPGSKFSAFQSESQYHFNRIFRPAAIAFEILTSEWEQLLTATPQDTVASPGDIYLKPDWILGDNYSVVL